MPSAALSPPKRGEQQDEELYLQAVLMFLFFIFRFCGYAGKKQEGQEGKGKANFSLLKSIASEFKELKGLFPRGGGDKTYALHSARAQELFSNMNKDFKVTIKPRPRTEKTGKKESRGAEKEWEVDATEDHSKTIETKIKSLPPILPLDGLLKKQDVVDYLRSDKFREHTKTPEVLQNGGLRSPDLKRHIRDHFKLGIEMSGQVDNLLEGLRKQEKVWRHDNGKVLVT